MADELACLVNTPRQSRPVDDRLEAPLHQILDVEIEDVIDTRRFRQDSKPRKTSKVLTFNLGLLFFRPAEERSCYPAYLREHRLMTPELPLVSETVLTKKMELRFELFLSPWMTRSLVRLSRLSRISQVLVLLLFLLPTRCRSCRFHENFLLDSHSFS